MKNLGKKILTVMLFGVLVNAVTEGDFGTIGRLKITVGCIIELLEQVYPSLTLLLITFGAFVYLKAADEPQEKLMGKKYIMMAVIGAVIVYLLIYFACYIGIGGNTVCPDDCVPANDWGEIEIARDGGLDSPPDGGPPIG